MSDSTGGTAYTIVISYAVNSSNEAVFDSDSSSIDPTPPDGSKTTIDGSGNITLGKKDSATISYTSATNGWSIYELQLKDKDKSHWGLQSGSNRLTSDEAADYPGVPANSGTVLADANDLEVLKSQEVILEQEHQDGAHQRDQPAADRP